MKVASVETVEKEAKYLRLCIYGEPGSGKTWFGASAALDELTSPVLFLNARAQIASLRSNPAYMEAIKDRRLVILTLEEYAELNYIYTWLFRGSGIESLDELFAQHGPPKTIVLDSLTELQRIEILRVGGNPADKLLRDVEPPQIQHWGSLLSQFTLLAHLYYQLPYHICFVGLEGVEYARHVVGETPRATGYRIALQGSAQRLFPAYALTVMRLERAPRGSGAFVLGHTRGTISKTKEQTGFFPAQILDPTIPALAKLLQQ